jgi:cellulose synthase operon protein C
MFRFIEHAERVHRFADGELSAADASAFQDHVGECPDCQKELETVLLLRGRLRDLPGLPPARSSRPARPAADPPPGFRSPGRRTVLASATLVAAAAGLLLVLRPGRDIPVSPAVAQAFDALAPGQRRPLVERLTYRPAARYRRPPATMRAARSAAAVPIDALTAARDRGDVHGELALWLWAGDSDEASTVAAHTGRDPDLDNDLAVLAMRRSHLDEAKDRLDRLLQGHTEHTAALWNRALLLERRGERAAAIRDYEAVATYQEAGWADEARERAAQLRLRLPPGGPPPPR